MSSENVTGEGALKTLGLWELMFSRKNPQRDSSWVISAMAGVHGLLPGCDDELKLTPAVREIEWRFRTLLAWSMLDAMQKVSG